MKFGQIKKGAIELCFDHPRKLCTAAPERDCIYGIRKIRVHIFVLNTALFSSHICRYKKKNTIDANLFRVASIVFSKDGPSDWIRTSGLLNPIQARYQTSPHPDKCLSPDSQDIVSYLSAKCKHFFQIFLKFFIPSKSSGKRWQNPSCRACRACPPGMLRRSW